MRVAAGVEVELAYRRAAGQVVDCMGRAAERAQARAAAQPDLVGNCSSSFSLASASNQTCRPHGPSPRLAALRRRAMPFDLPRQRRTQLRSHIAPHAHRTALARHLDQRTVAAPGLDPHPVAVELRALRRCPRVLQLDHQPAAPAAKSSRRRSHAAHTARNAMPDRRQFEPRRTAAPAPRPGARRNRADPQRHDAQRGVEPAQLAGVTEQLRFRNQWMVWPWTVAKRNTGFDTGDVQQINRGIVARASIPGHTRELTQRRIVAGRAALVRPAAAWPACPAARRRFARSCARGAPA